jgi:hypothetical protein
MSECQSAPTFRILCRVSGVSSLGTNNSGVPPALFVVAAARMGTMVLFVSTYLAVLTVSEHTRLVTGIRR